MHKYSMVHGRILGNNYPGFGEKSQDCQNCFVVRQCSTWLPWLQGHFVGYSLAQYIRMTILYVAAQYPTEFVFTLVVYVFVLILARFTVYFVDFSFL